MKGKNILGAVIAITICELAGAVGSLFTSAAIPTWYATLVRPAVAPPNWVFAPVWTLLYASMGIAAFIIWKKGLPRRAARAALFVFALQLVLNVLWSVIFFGAKNLGAALIEIVLLWIAILATIILFARLSRTAALLLVPYILWVTFAGYLTYSFWALN